MQALSRSVLSKCLISLVLSMPMVTAAADDSPPVCLYVSSYHSGYEWSDAIEQALESTLGVACSLEKFYMDTKRNPSVSFGQRKALEAKTLIDELRPNVVIACDDNASQYLVMPYFRDHELPIVFCGVNHTAAAYGYPYSNVTGILEIAPVIPTIEMIRTVLGEVSRGVYLSMDIYSQHKEFSMNQRVYGQHGIELDRILISSMDEWVEGFVNAQSYPFAIIGSSGGIEGWDLAYAEAIALEHSETLTVTNMGWLKDVAMLTVTKIADEQGAWAAQLAKRILAGHSPADFPIVSNRRWNLHANRRLFAAAEIDLPTLILEKAITDH